LNTENDTSKQPQQQVNVAQADIAFGKVYMTPPNTEQAGDDTSEQDEQV
jgi:hypothetical protein